MRGLKKLVTKPGVYFRDYLLKRHPLPPTKAPTKSTGKITPKASTLVPLPATAAGASIAKPPAAPSITKYYYDNYDGVTVKPGLVLLDSFWGRKIGCNPYALYQAMKADSRFADCKFIWVRNDGVPAPEDAANDPRTSFVKHATIAHAKALLEAEVLICNSNFPPYFNRKPHQVYAPTWHGVPIKTLGFDVNSTLNGSSNTQRNFLTATDILMPNAYCTEHVVDAYGAPSDRLAVHEIGSPRVDLTLKADKADVRRRLGVNHNKDVLLFAPTWRGRMGAVSSEIAEQLAAVKLLEREFSSTHQIFVSLHHLTRKELTSSGSMSAHVPDHIDINEVLAATDILVSDYSSIFVDFMPLDRPIVLFTPDREQYESERGLYMKLEDLPSSLARSEAELVSAIRSARRPSSFSNYEAATKLLVPLEDGSASARALDIISKRLNGAARQPSSASQKVQLLIHPGGLFTNGITSSFLSLLREIDYDKVDVTVLVAGDDLDKDAAKLDNFHKFDPRCRVILRTGTTAVSTAKQKLYLDFTRGTKQLSVDEVASLVPVFSQEYRRLLGDLEFDVAIDFSGYSPLWAMLVASAPSKRKVIYQHSDMMAEVHRPGREKKILMNVFSSYRFFDSAISVSKEVMENNNEALSSYYGEHCVATYAHNSVSPSILSEQSQTPLALTMKYGLAVAQEPALFKFVSVGRLSPEKNQTRLLRAFAQAHNCGLNAVLFLVGDGPDRETLQALSSELRISERVVFTGRLGNPHALVKRCDCLVMPSDYEGQGLAIIEALALGVPVVATDIPAARSLVGSANGIICGRDATSMASALSAVTSNKLTVAFDLDGYCANAMAEFYQNVLGDDDHGRDGQLRQASTKQ